MNKLHFARALAAFSLTTMVVAACGGTSNDGLEGTGLKPGDGGVEPGSGGAGGGTAGTGGKASACNPGARMGAGDGCNSCTCTEKGVWACTLIACLPGSGGAGNGTGGVSASGGRIATGGAVATGGAIATGGTGGVCTDGDTKMLDCNTCICGGGSWACTKKACPPVICKDGETKFDGCNTCSCVNGLWNCTLKYCPPTVCKDGETKTDGCNSCKCAGGTWACTDRACPPGDAGTPKGCGGWLGNTCSASEYCAYKEGQLCGAADASSTCQPRPTGCNDIYAPVCGCDGKTYSNDCDAASHGTGVNHAKACQ